jgi:hypothetical protein
MTIAGFVYNPDHYITRPDPTRPAFPSGPVFFVVIVAKVAMIHRKI